MKLIKDKMDLTYLKWSHIRGSSGTAGTFLKAESIMGNNKTYYKLSNFDYDKGVVGHECINELIVDRLLTLLGVNHLEYQLINSEIEIDGTKYNTYLCSSTDFKKRYESKVALDDYYRLNSFKGESHYEFCERQGWRKYIDQMLVVDYLILNRDRHGANIEVLRNSKENTIRLAPLFDHGVSLMYSCMTEDDISKYDILEDKPCNNFVGSKSTYENLELVDKSSSVFVNELQYRDKEYLFEGLEEIISEAHRDKVWEMIYKRYQTYENLRTNR